MKLSIIIAGFLIASSGAAMADDTGFYLYGSAGKGIASLDQGAIDSGYANTHSISSVSSSTSGDPSAYQLQFGYQFNQKSAIETGYVKFGNLTYTLNAPTQAHESEKMQAFDLVYASTLQFSNGFSLTSRAGLVYTNSSGNGAIRDFDGHAIRLTGGLGVKYNVTENMSIRADWNGYSTPPAAKIDNGYLNMFTVGVGYKF